MEDQTQSRGNRATPRRLGLRFALVTSLILHVIPFPAHLLQGMAGWLWHRGEKVADVDHPTIIPIELMEEDKPPEGQKPEDEFVEPATTASAKRPGVADAGVDAEDAGKGLDAGDAAVDADAGPDAEAGGPDAARLLDEGGIASVATSFGLKKPPPASSERPVAALMDGGSTAADAGPEAGAVAVADPIRLAGQASTLMSNPNIALTMYPERIRRHALAAHFAPTLQKIREWQAFFKGTGLDPIQDTDRIYVGGPQFRDFRRVSAVIRYKVSQQRMREAVNGIVDRNKGEWAADAGVPTARAQVDKGDRVFVMSAPNILVVVPPDGARQAPGVTHVPAGQANLAFALYLRTPRNAFQGYGLPVDIPAALSDLHFNVLLASDGGADLKIDMKDRDATTAEATARQLTDDIEKLAVISVLFQKKRLYGPVQFRAVGDHIYADTHLTEDQLRTILSMIATQIDMAGQKAAAAAAAPRSSGGG